jgi:threonine aldolase
MYAYGARASLGDDVYHEPCTKSLEEHVAQLTGKEAGLFLPSGTMSNQIAIRAHLKEPPHSVLLDKRSHIYLYEAAGTAFFSGAQEIPVLPANGQYCIRLRFNLMGRYTGHHLTVSDITANIVEGDDVHLFVLFFCY